MKELNFESGLVTYSINGKCEVSFNPTDSNFVERMLDAVEALEKKQDGYRHAAERMEDGKSVFDLSRKLDGEMREIIDGIFGVPVCEAVFADMNVYAVAGGLPVWANMLIAVMDEMRSAMEAEQKAMDSRIAKYLKKYSK